jgi:hypothetical protein
MSLLLAINIMVIFPNITFMREVKDIVTEYEITGDEPIDYEMEDIDKASIAVTEIIESRN